MSYMGTSPPGFKHCKPSQTFLTNNLQPDGQATDTTCGGMSKAHSAGQSSVDTKDKQSTVCTAANPSFETPSVKRPRQELAFVVHAFALLCYVRVWLWHLTPDAKLLPGATGFGWFFRYLTFYSFTLQLLALFLSCLSDVTQVRHTCSNTPSVDTMACLSFLSQLVVFDCTCYCCRSQPGNSS
jgi:hypothetical protein